ncbi:MAG: hypothetical protein ACI83P_001560 [Janthinobacterium sp.]|jgi:hypothetical protein
MEKNFKSVAKRMIFSLVVVSALGGCAAYPSAPHAQSSYYGATPISVGIGYSDNGYTSGDYRKSNREYRSGKHGYRSSKHDRRGHSARSGRGKDKGRGHGRDKSRGRH